MTGREKIENLDLPLPPPKGDKKKMNLYIFNQFNRL